MFRLQVSGSRPYFDIKTTNAKVEIHNEPLRLKVEREPARMHVRRTRPKMKVDWDRVRNESGLKTPSAQRRHMQQVYRQKALENIANISGESEQMSNLQNAVPGGPELVATVALDSVLHQDIPVVDVVNMPRSMPDVEWEEGKLEIEWDPPIMEMHWEGSLRPEITVTPHTVEIRLINGETIRVGENEARMLEQRGYGKRLDEKI